MAQRTDRPRLKPQPDLDKALVLELARLDFLHRHDDLVITGDNGTGKSHLLKAFALRACEQGIRVRYARCVDLLDHAGDDPVAARLRQHLELLGLRSTASSAGPAPSSCSSTTSASARSSAATTSRPPRIRSTTSSTAVMATPPPPSPRTSPSATGAATSAMPP